MGNIDNLRLEQARTLLNALHCNLQTVQSVCMLSRKKTDMVENIVEIKAPKARKETTVGIERIRKMLTWEQYMAPASSC